MKVLHLTPCLFGPERGITGGAERYVVELARHMATRIPTRLLAFEHQPRRETCGSLEVRTLRPAGYGGCSWNPLPPPGFIRELRWADVIHCHQYKLCIASLSALYGRLSGRPVFATDLGGAGRDISSYVSTDRWYRGHLHISEFSRRLAGHAGGDRARVIYGGVAHDLFRPDESVVRDAGALFVGRLLPHKGVDVLLRALPNEMPLTIVGREANPAYLQLLQKLAEGRQVRFVRDAGDSDLADLYRRARCVVLPSVHRTAFGDEIRAPELLGQTLLEGMACGAPGVCSDAASLPEVVRDGKTGFVVPWGDAQALGERLGWLRDHPQEARDMGRAAAEEVRLRFAWPRVVDACLEAYRDALGASGRGAHGSAGNPSSREVGSCRN